MTITSASASSFLALTLLCFSFSAYTCFANCHIDDETGLLAFKAGITQDPSGKLSSWIPGTDCCTWSGIWCLAKDKRVSSLSLYEEGDPEFTLSGTISPSLTKVRYLQGLLLQNLRNLTGTFPTFIYDLPDLNGLSLDNNKLTGPLPSDIGQKLYRRLVTFTLSGNKFTGTIPSSISQLVHLRDLDLGSNHFSGPIPNGIDNMKNLLFLNLDNNQLSGKIPNFFTPLTFLRGLDLSHNKLSGEIPPSISFLAPRLERLNLGHNLLTGKIPNYLSNFQNLNKLDLSYNHLCGPIPATKFAAKAFLGNDCLCGSPLPPCKK
ncbi:Leucine-rich repeat receptor-like protein kinase pxc2 [Thalictrum thalictroides]|uniref:Leucine-rich repeat receptor-like protein kinase pxc2 n=1 Tax=Thalictrum thalictroides TaxID=46969 RepID=A0A7J6VFW4_THATH|nr:Leucine-rich repeat receptor-like protein kinase pxc2 [Thalictrum thalictroides]